MLPKIIRCLLLLAVIIPWTIGCHSFSHRLTQREFTQLYADSLSHRFPKIKFTVAGEHCVTSSYQGFDTRAYTDNAFTRYNDEPDSLAQIISIFVASAAETYDMQAVTADNIIATIKPVAYLHMADNLAADIGAKKTPEFVYDTYNDQLIIVYAADSKSSIRTLTKQDLEKSGLPRDSLRSMATRNLSRVLTDIQVRGSDGVFMFTAGGNYEASLILLRDLWTKQNLPVNGDFIIAIPSRDVLVITGSNDKAGIAKLKTLTTKIYGEGNYAVSDQLYKWAGNRFEKYE